MKMAQAGSFSWAASLLLAGDAYAGPFVAQSCCIPFLPFPEFWM